MSKEIEQRFVPRYEPPPHIPAFFREGLTTIGGLNPFGEPNLQIVWGMDARVFRSGNPEAVKYLGTTGADLGMPALIVEEWWSPERFGSLLEWENNRYFTNEAGKRVDAIGDYPARGRYYMMPGGLLLNEVGAPSALTESTLEYIAGMYKNRLAPAVSAEDNARRYREMLDKQTQMERMQHKAKDEANAADWDEMRGKWEQGAIDQTREFSFAKNFSKKGNLFLPN